MPNNGPQFMADINLPWSVNHFYTPTTVHPCPLQDVQRTRTVWRVFGKRMMQLAGIVRVNAAKPGE